MKFPKSDLQELAYGGASDYLEVIQEPEMYEQSRWTTYYQMIFEFDNKFYSTTFGRGSTECQEESPYEYEDDMVECYEVEPIEVTKIEYRLVK